MDGSDKTTIEVMCLGGRESHLEAKRGTEVFAPLEMSTLCGVEERSGQGKKFVVLEFGGKARRNFEDEVTKFASVTEGKYLARVDEQSWLADATGKKFKNGLLKTCKGKHTLSFEVPSDASGRVWYYGKKQYQLEPHPVEVEAAKQ